MSLPDGAEYWWDVKGWTKLLEKKKFPPKHGIRKCPYCNSEVQCIKHGKRHCKEFHPELSIPADFPLVAPIHPR